MIFHAAANAADGNGIADGDFVYTATVESSPLTASVSPCGYLTKSTIGRGPFRPDLPFLEMAERLT